MSETPQTVSEWAEATFGPAGSNFSVACRANREMGELLQALAADPAHPKAAGEAADVAIVLYRLAWRMGLSPGEKTVESRSPPVLAAVANGRLSVILTRLSYDEDYPIDWDLHLCIAPLRGLAEMFGTTLDAEIDRKMKTNRARRWVLDGNGHGQHVKGGAE